MCPTPYHVFQFWRGQPPLLSLLQQQAHYVFQFRTGGRWANAHTQYKAQKCCIFQFQSGAVAHNYRHMPHASIQERGRPLPHLMKTYHIFQFRSGACAPTPYERLLHLSVLERGVRPHTV